MYYNYNKSKTVDKNHEIELHIINVHPDLPAGTSFRQDQ